MQPRSIRMRWWMWLVAAVLVVASGGVALRAYGQAQFARTQAAIAAIGLSTDLAAWVAAAPPVDRDRQRRAQRLMHGIGSWPDKPGHLPFADLQEQRPRPQDVAARDAMLVAGRADAAAMAALLDEGPVLISLLGFVERDPAWLARPPVADLVDQRLYVNLLAARGLANWWAASACQSDDPRRHLRPLRSFSQALAQPGSLIDAMSALAIGVVHDQTCLHLATRGRLPADEAAAWLAIDLDHLRMIADGFAGERCLSVAWSTQDDDLRAIAWAYAGYSPSLIDRVASLPSWCIMPSDWASTISQLAGIEAGLRGLPAPPVVQPPFGIKGIAAISIPNLNESTVTACESAYLARLHRVAGILALRVRSGSPLPADAAELAPFVPDRLLARQDADRPAIAYERLGATRFRIGLAGGIRPAMIPASRWGPGYTGEMGFPASAKASVRTRWSLEIDLDAILVPPPERPARKAAP